MTTIEPILRKADFSRGRSFIGADGGRWYLPVINESSWDRYPEIRAYYEGYYGEGGPKANLLTARMMVNVQALGQSLLMDNYEFIYNEYARLIMDPDGVSSLLATDAILKSIATPIIHAIAFTEHNGYDRSEATGFVLAMIAPKVAIGWHSHDGIMFDN